MNFPTETLILNEKSFKKILTDGSYAGKVTFIDFDSGIEEELMYDEEEIENYIYHHSIITYQKTNILEIFDIYYDYHQDLDNSKHGKMRSLLLTKLKLQR